MRKILFSIIATAMVLLCSCKQVNTKITPADPIDPPDNIGVRPDNSIDPPANIYIGMPREDFLTLYPDKMTNPYGEGIPLP